jgi:hypothetical protein
MKRAHKSPRVHRAQEPTRVKTGRPIEKRGHGDQPPLAFRAPALAPRLAQTRLSTESISFRLRLSSILAPTTALHVFRKSRNRGNPGEKNAGGLGARRARHFGQRASANMHRPTCVGPYASARMHRPVSIGRYASARMHRPICIGRYAEVPRNSLQPVCAWHSKNSGPSSCACPRDAILGRGKHSGEAGHCPNCRHLWQSRCTSSSRERDGLALARPGDPHIACQGCVRAVRDQSDGVRLRNRDSALRRLGVVINLHGIAAMQRSHSWQEPKPRPFRGFVLPPSWYKACMLVA